MLVWTLIMGFAVDGEARTIASFQRAYSAVTNQTVARSSFYDRFTPALAALLSDLLKHALEEVAVLHMVAPQFELFRNVLIADATVSGCIGSSMRFPRLTRINPARNSISCKTRPSRRSSSSSSPINAPTRAANSAPGVGCEAGCYCSIWASTVSAG